MTADVEQAMTGPVEQLLREPGRWTQGCIARDKDGLAVNWDDESATCWCLVGAYTKCVDNPDFQRLFAVLENEPGFAVYRSIPAWNDAPERTHADIMRVVRKAGI